MSSCTITRVQDWPDLEQWQAVTAAAFAHDFEHLPADPIEERVPDMDGTVPRSGERTELWLASNGGVGVAAAALHLPTLDNTESGSIDLRVHPQHRRQGHGRALLNALLAELTRLGRPRVHVEVPSPYPHGEGPLEPMLRALGARPVLREVRRTVDLHAHPVTSLPPSPDGYRVHQWADTAPDGLVDDLAYLKHRLSTDAPLGEMDWEPEQWDADRYREEEASTRTRGRRRWSTAVEHLDSGRLVGLTELVVSERSPQVGYQWATLVVTEHRGRALGMLLKACNHRLVGQESPRTRWINTWNAESNTFMVSVNEALGFVPMEYWTGWQR